MSSEMARSEKGVPVLTPSVSDAVQAMGAISQRAIHIYNDIQFRENGSHTRQFPALHGNWTGPS